jgi:hypothetical protein
MAITLGTTRVELQKAKPGLYLSPVASSFLIGGFGLLLFLIAGGKALLNYFYSTQGSEIVAAVTWSGTSYSGHSSYRTVRYAFTLPDGRTFRGSQTGYSATGGGPILVSYLPDHPSFNRVTGSERPDQKWLPFVALVGAFFVFAGFQSYGYQQGKVQSGEFSSDLR